MKDLVVHKINIAHYRLVELSNLSDQEKPFYDWVERCAKRVTGSHKSLHEILISISKNQIKSIIEFCFQYENEEKPLLFDGIGRVYPHHKACFYFFAWMIRDAPQQRLAPLITRMQKADNITRSIAEIDALSELIFEYRSTVKSFEWQSVREVIIDRLEGSRRSISGNIIEARIRTNLITAIQNYYAIYNNYGAIQLVDIADKQIKIGKHTIDVSAKFKKKHSNDELYLLMPVKTRETEGGGHSHLFTRDIISALSDIKSAFKNCVFIVIIIAENWSSDEIKVIDDKIDLIFHFNMSPNQFNGFDDESQIQLNQYIESI